MATKTTIYIGTYDEGTNEIFIWHTQKLMNTQNEFQGEQGKENSRDDITREEMKLKKAVTQKQHENATMCFMSVLEHEPNLGILFLTIFFLNLVFS